jgi:hypothetical protein
MCRRDITVVLATFVGIAVFGVVSGQDDDRKQAKFTIEMSYSKVSMGDILHLGLRITNNTKGDIKFKGHPADELGTLTWNLRNVGSMTLHRIHTAQNVIATVLLPEQTLPVGQEWLSGDVFVIDPAKEEWKPGRYRISCVVRCAAGHPTVESDQILEIRDSPLDPNTADRMLQFQNRFWKGKWNDRMARDVELLKMEKLTASQGDFLEYALLCIRFFEKAPEAELRQTFMPFTAQLKTAPPLAQYYYATRAGKHLAAAKQCDLARSLYQAIPQSYLPRYGLFEALRGYCDMPVPVEK